MPPSRRPLEFFLKAQNRIQDPAKLRRLIIDLIDRESWSPFRKRSSMTVVSAGGRDRAGGPRHRPVGRASRTTLIHVVQDPARMGCVALERTTMPADEVRAPFVPRGNVVIVTRYREDVAKVALVNPEDLAMLEESHELVQRLGRLDPEPIGDLALKAIELEDRPRVGARVEDPERIAAILGL